MGRPVPKRELTTGMLMPFRMSVSLLVIASAVFLTGLWRYYHFSDIDPVVPEGQFISLPVPRDLSMLEGALADRIRAHLQAVRARPGDPDAYGRLAMVYEAHAFFRLARQCYARAVSIDPSNPRWRYHWAVLLHKAGDSEAAEQAFRSVISSKPDYAPAHERLGLLLLERNAYKEAANAFQHVIRLRPNEAAGYIGLARAKLAAGAYREAVELLNKALTIEPTCQLAHYTLGRVYQRLGRFAEATIEFALGARAEPVLLADPWRADVQSASVGRKMKLRMAQELLGHGQHTKAVEMLEELMPHDPQDADVAASLGLAYLAVQRPEDAKRVLLRALEVRPDAFRTHGNLAAVLLELGELDAALSHAQEATRLAPMQEWLFFVKGLILEQLGRYEDALASFHRAAQLNTPNPGVYVHMGQVLLHLQRVEEAIEPFRNAVAFNPKSVMIRYNLAMIYAQTGRFDQAAQTLRAALTLDPENERVRQALARAEESLSPR